MKNSVGPRLERERRTALAMVTLYCRRHHPDRRDGGALCPDCSRLFAYAAERLERCVFGEYKPTCGKCPIHCYRPRERERMREVMRRSGPGMMGRHPWLTLRHWLDSLSPVPEIPGRPR